MRPRREETMRARASLLVLAIAVATIPMALSGQQPPSNGPAVYLDPAQPIDKRVDDLISRLTLEEKGYLLGNTAPAIERLKVPVMNGWNQSLHGIVWTQP